MSSGSGLVSGNIPGNLLQHILIAVALNLARFVAWITEVPLAETRTSAFAALASAEI